MGRDRHPRGSRRSLRGAIFHGRGLLRRRSSVPESRSSRVATGTHEGSGNRPGLTGTTHGPPRKLRDQTLTADVGPVTDETLGSVGPHREGDAGVTGSDWITALEARFGPGSRTLSEREIFVIALHSGVVDGRLRTREEVATEFGVSAERIRLIEVMAFSGLVHRERTGDSSVRGLVEHLRQLLDSG